MGEICPKCGLMKPDLCICETVAREQQEIVVRIEQKRFKKKVTVIEGLDKSGVDLNKLAKSLKGKLACGGTVSDRKIMLQGDHRRKIKEVLAKEGFKPENIKIE